MVDLSVPFGFYSGDCFDSVLKVKSKTLVKGDPKAPLFISYYTEV